MVVAWLWGGHTERFAVGVQALSWMAFGSFRWMVGDVYIDSMIEDSLGLLIFGWLAFHSNRWWPFVATAALGLAVLVHVLTMVTDISWEAAVSARVGMGLLIHLSLLASVAERWLAGERAVSDDRIWTRRRTS
ncbi:MAG: hypothetical protein KL785_03220 [Brevundimonas sp.]|nr:hypothetical protein [Brevundimonas sp.]